MASGSVDRLNNLFIHLLHSVGVEKEPARAAHNRTPTLRRATPGLVVAVLVWSLVFVLSIGTNGALAAALAQHLSFPPALVDAFSSLTGERRADTERDLTDLLVPSPVPEVYDVHDSGQPPFAGNGVARSSTIVSWPQTSPNHGGLFGLDFLHTLANNHSPYADVSAPPDAWTRGGVANRIGTGDPVRAGRRARAARGVDSDERSEPPAAHDVVAPFASEPAIDSGPWAASPPNTAPASTPTVDEVVMLDDDLGTQEHPPTTLRDGDLPPMDFVLDPRLDDIAHPAAALAATSVPGPGTMGLLAGAFVAWPIAKRMRIASALRKR